MTNIDFGIGYPIVGPLHICLAKDSTKKSIVTPLIVRLLTDVS